MLATDTAAIIHTLLDSNEPAIRYKTLAHVLRRDPGSAEVAQVQEEIRTCQRVESLITECVAPVDRVHHPYAKFHGAHWVLATLADIGYPPGDARLKPLRDRVLDWLLGESHQHNIRTIAGRTRRCASQEGNALYALLALGLADERCDELARRLRAWQWPDGGWNCDKRPQAQISSFMESLIPLRALTLHAQATGSDASRTAAWQAAEPFLSRRLYQRRSDGSIIDEDFTRLHYPCYWHYDILFALKVLAEAGRLDDPRCQAALDLLEAKRLPDGGFPAEGRYYRFSQNAPTGRSPVDWGGVSVKRMNLFVTVDALYVLSEAGRLH